MLIAILILTIFNIGLTMLLIGGAIGVIKDYIDKAVDKINNNTDEDMSSIGTAIFNAESIKHATAARAAASSSFFMTRSF